MNNGIGDALAWALVFMLLTLPIALASMALEIREVKRICGSDATYPCQEYKRERGMGETCPIRGFLFGSCD